MAFKAHNLFVDCILNKKRSRFLHYALLVNFVAEHFFKPLYDAGLEKFFHFGLPFCKKRNTAINFIDHLQDVGAKVVALTLSVVNKLIKRLIEKRPDKVPVIIWVKVFLHVEHSFLLDDELERHRLASAQRTGNFAYSRSIFKRSLRVSRN